MKTFDLESWRDYDAALAEAKSALLADEMIVYPTDTLYGLGASALSEEAVRKVAVAKGREGKPISITVSDLVMMRGLAEVPMEVAVFLQQLLPGPFTVILKTKTRFPQEITTTDRIGVRIPHHMFILSVVRQLGFPITATSANLSGQKAAARLEDVPQSVKEAAAVLIDGGPTRWRQGSTVIDFTPEKPQILRRGANCELAESLLKDFVRK